MHLKLLPLLLLLIIAISACEKEAPILENSAESERKIISSVERQVETVREQASLMQLRAFSRIPSNAIELAAGSVDGLAAAIAEAGKGGTVLVKAGEHMESQPVVITEKVSIIGEKGAVLISGVEPISRIGFMQAALHLKDAQGISIHGLEMRAQTDFGGTAIFVENAPGTFISNNSMTNFETGILNHHGDHSYFGKNTILGASAWLSDPSIFIYGIVNMNGKRVRIYSNSVSNTSLGIWACDEKGLATGNTTNENFIGFILCKVPLSIPLSDGTILGSDKPGGEWIVHHNTANKNFHVGIIAIDGANNSLLIMNKAANNTDANIELAGDSERFGFFTPTSNKIKVISAPGVSVKDCGVDNSVFGGELIDPALSPCY